MLAISLFSGAGGDTLGLKQAGITVTAYSEISKICCTTHDTNFTNCELISENNITDITRVSNETLSKYTGKVDLITAGFPCQGFSNAGKKRDDDPRNTLFKDFVRVTRVIQPSIIIGENVKGLLKKKSSSGTKFIDLIDYEFKLIGYNIKYQVCKTDQYGVPQKRERLIILGTRNKWKLEFPPPLLEKPNLLDIVKYSMEGAVQIPQEMVDNIPAECILTDMNDSTQSKTPIHPYLLRKLNPTVEQKTYLMNKQLVQFTHLFSFGKRDSPIHCEIIDIRNPCKTIICTYSHQPRLFVPLKNKSGYFLRCLLPDELKQIQGFPKDYIFCGNTKEKIAQIGNAIPPPLIKHIVEHLMSVNSDICKK